MKSGHLGFECFVALLEVAPPAFLLAQTQHHCGKVGLGFLDGGCREQCLVGVALLRACGHVRRGGRAASRASRGA